MALPVPQEEGRAAWARCTPALLAVLQGTASPAQGSWVGRGSAGPLVQHGRLELPASAASWACQQHSQLSGSVRSPVLGYSPASREIKGASLYMAGFEAQFSWADFTFSDCGLPEYA